MKKIRSLLCIMLAALLLVGTVPAFAADKAASPTGGLNGSTCAGADFDTSVYTDITNELEVRNNRYQWPSSGTVLVTAGATNPNYTIAKFNGVTIPAGLVVDFYRYYCVDAQLNEMYVLLGHFDTTDGKPYTIGSGTGKNAAAYSPKANTSCDATKWGTVTKSIVPGTPKAKYDSANYVDVAPGTAYYDAVMTLTDNGIVGGYGDGTFKPDDAITNGQVVVIRTILRGDDITSQVYDYTYRNGYQPCRDGTAATRAFTACIVAGKAFQQGTTHPNWLTDYECSLVAGSYGLKRFDGSDGSMRPAIYDAWRGSIGRNIKYLSSIDQFADADTIHKWIDENADFICEQLVVSGPREERISSCERYFMCAYNLGMFGTDADGNFDPYGTVTRAQFCQALYDIGWTYKGCLDYDACYRTK